MMRARALRVSNQVAIKKGMTRTEGKLTQTIGNDGVWTDNWWWRTRTPAQWPNYWAQWTVTGQWQTAQPIDPVAGRDDRTQWTQARRLKAQAEQWRAHWRTQADGRTVTPATDNDSQSPSYWRLVVDIEDQTTQLLTDRRTANDQWRPVIVKDHWNDETRTKAEIELTVGREDGLTQTDGQLDRRQWRTVNDPEANYWTMTTIIDQWRKPGQTQYYYWHWQWPSYWAQWPDPIVARQTKDGQLTQTQWQYWQLERTGIDPDNWMTQKAQPDGPSQPSDSPGPVGIEMTQTQWRSDPDRPGRMTAQLTDIDEWRLLMTQWPSDPVVTVLVAMNVIIGWQYCVDWWLKPSIGIGQLIDWPDQRTVLLWWYCWPSYWPDPVTDPILTRQPSYYWTRTLVVIIEWPSPGNETQWSPGQWRASGRTRLTRQWTDQTVIDDWPSPIGNDNDGRNYWQ